MAKSSNMFILAALIAVGAIFQGSEAQTAHTVGGTTGWTIPPDAATYTAWTSQQTIAVGDVLVFNFVAGSHDVAEVTKAAYDGCTTASPIFNTATAPANITLTTSGEHYFICTFPAHCDAGQKLTVTVSSASTATPPSTTAMPPSTTATPPSTISMPPSTTATPPSTIAMPPSTTATPPSTIAMPPSTIATPPSTSAMPPSTTATPPSTTATPPSTMAMPPLTTATPPTGLTAPPTTSTVPSSPSPSGSTVPPSPSSATSLATAALPVALLSFALAFVH